MGDMVQYVGSLFSGGLIFLMLIGFFSSVGQTAVTQTFNTVVQENSSSATDVIEREFRLMGYGSTDSGRVLRAESSAVAFTCDIDDDGLADTLMYELGPPLGLGGNPHSRVVYRTVNGNAPSPVASGVTKFALRFYDSAGTPTVTGKDVRLLTVSMLMESETRMDDRYAGVYWERTIKPKNLR